MVFTGDGGDPRLVDLTDRLAGRADVAVLCVTSTEPRRGRRRASVVGPRRPVTAAYGVTAGELTAVVLDPNLRVVGVATGDRLADQVVALLDGAVHRDPAIPPRDRVRIPIR